MVSSASLHSTERIVLWVTVASVFLSWPTVATSVATPCSAIASNTITEIDSALIDCAPTFTFLNVGLHAKNADVTYSQLWLNNPTFTFPNSLGTVVVEDLVVWGLQLDVTLFSFSSISDSGSITFRNNNITAHSAKTILNIYSSIGNSATVSIVGNKVQFTVTGTLDHYLAAIGAVIGNDVAVDFQDNAMAATGRSAGTITLRMFQLSSAIVSGASLNVERNTIDVSGALCDGDQCTASDNLQVIAASPQLEVTVAYFYMTPFTFRVTSVQDNTVLWAGALVRRYLNAFVVFMYNPGNTLYNEMIISGNSLRVDASNGTTTCVSLIVVYMADVSVVGRLLVLGNSILVQNLSNSTTLINVNVAFLGHVSASGALLIGGNTITVRSCMLKVINGTQGQLVGNVLAVSLSVRGSGANFTICNNTLLVSNVTYFKDKPHLALANENFNIVSIANVTLHSGTEFNVHSNTVRCSSRYAGVSLDGGRTFDLSTPVNQDYPFYPYHRVFITYNGFSLTRGSKLSLRGNLISMSPSNTLHAVGELFIAFTHNQVVLGNSTMEVTGNMVNISAGVKLSFLSRLITIQLTGSQIDGGDSRLSSIELINDSSVVVSQNNLMSLVGNGTTSVTVTMLYVVSSVWYIEAGSSLEVLQNTVTTTTHSVSCTTAAIILFSSANLTLEGVLTVESNTLNVEIDAEGDRGFSLIDMAILNPAVCSTAIIGLVQFTTSAVALASNVSIAGNSLAVRSAEYPTPSSTVSILSFDSIPTRLDGSLHIEGNAVATEMLFACRTYSSHIAALVRLQAAGVPFRGVFAVSSNSVSSIVYDDASYGPVLGKDSCAPTNVALRAFWVSLSVSLSGESQLLVVSNVLTQRLYGRAAMLGASSQLLINAQFVAFPEVRTVERVVVSHNIANMLIVSDPTFNVTELVGPPACSGDNSVIEINIEGSAIVGTAANSDLAVVRMSSNTVNLTSRPNGTLSGCRIATVNFTSFPQHVLAVLATDNRFGVTAYGARAAVLDLYALELRGTLRFERSMTADVLSTVNNTVFLSLATTSSFSSLHSLAPVALDRLLPTPGTRPKWRACTNYVAVATSTILPAQITPVGRYRTATTVNKVNKLAFEATHCESNTLTVSRTRSQTPSVTTSASSPSSTAKQSPSTSPIATGSDSLVDTTSHSPSHEPTPTLPTQTATSTLQLACARLLPSLAAEPASSSTPILDECGEQRGAYPLQLLWLGSGLDPATNTSGAEETVTAIRQAAAAETCLPPYVEMSIPYTRWGHETLSYRMDGGGLVYRASDWMFHDLLPLRLAALRSLTTVVVAPQYATTIGPNIANPSSIVEVAITANNHTATSMAELTVSVKYVGAGSPQGGYVVRVSIPAEQVLRCSGPEMLVLSLTLTASPPLVDSEGVANVVGATTGVVSGLVGSPGGAVRGGILSSLSDLLQCEPRDLTAEQSLLANPFNIALGRAEGQYVRGGILSSLILLFLLASLIGLLSVPLTLVSLRRDFHRSSQDGTSEENSSPTAPTWRDAMAHTHLPGTLLVPMTLVGESWVPNGATLLSMPAARPEDLAIGAAALLMFWAYVAHLVVKVWCAPVALVSLESPPRREGTWRKWVLYWLRSPVGLVPCVEPAGEVVRMGREEYAVIHSFLPMQRMLRGDEGPGTRKAAAYYLRYAPYLDELNVLWFKVAELVLGSVINLAGGIVTDSCFPQGFAVLLCVAIVLLVLLWKRPLAVRGQQLTTGIVYGSMLVAAVVVVVNLFMHHSTLEYAATVLFLISTAFVVLQSATDLLISVVAAHQIVLKLLARHPPPNRSQRVMEYDHVGDLPIFNETHLQELLEIESSSSTTSSFTLLAADEERALQAQLLAELEEADREMEAAAAVYKRRWGEDRS